jgi:DNA-binding NarL/FixJ family response regulator
LSVRFGRTCRNLEHPSPSLRSGNAAILVRVPARDLRLDPLRLLVVDDDPMLTASLRAFLDNDDRLTVLQTARGLRAAVAAAVSLPVEVALVDVRLGGEDGYAVVDAIRNLEPRIVSVLMSGLDSGDVLAGAAAVGAAAVIQKHDFIAGAIDTIVAAWEDRRPGPADDSPSATVL